MKLERRRGALDVADTALAVVVGVLAIMAVLWVLSWIVGTVVFLFKLAVLGVIVAGVIALVNKARS